MMLWEESRRNWVRTAGSSDGSQSSSRSNVRLSKRFGRFSPAPRPLCPRLGVLENSSTIPVRAWWLFRRITVVVYRHPLVFRMQVQCKAIHYVLVQLWVSRQFCFDLVQLLFNWLLLRLGVIFDGFELFIFGCQHTCLGSIATACLLQLRHCLVPIMSLSFFRSQS